MKLDARLVGEPAKISKASVLKPDERTTQRLEIAFLAAGQPFKFSPVGRCHGGV